MTQRLEAEGASGGKKWDDGDDYEDVTKIYVRVGLHEGRFDGIQYIHFDYFKNGQSKYGSHHGLKGEGFTESKFEINYQNNEYLESVEGYYKIESNAIQALQFKTNFRTSEIMGYHHNYGTKFTLAVGRKKIIGFHGSSSSRNLNSLGAYFTWITPTKLESEGGKVGKEWDDGIDHENLTKIYVGIGHQGIQFIKFDYVKDGQPKSGEIHGDLGRGFTQVFVIDYPNEYLISVEGTYNTIPDDGVLVVRSLIFKTSKGRTSPTYGFVSGTTFVLEKQGNVIVSFHGRDGGAFDAIGVVFPVNELCPPLKHFSRQGGNGGSVWDDGAYDGVRRINVSLGGRFVAYCRFEYARGERMVPHAHGKLQNHPQPIAINHPDEYLESVEGWYDSSNIIQGIKFQTNKKTSDDIGYVFDGDGRQFSLKVKDKKIIGFHGFADSNLNSLGAYFVPISSSSAPSPNKLEAQGGNGGDIFDDGTFDDIRKVYVGQGESSVAYIRFEYEKNGKIETREHGKRTLLGTEEFEVGQDDYITSVEVYYEKIFGMPSEIITSLIFNTFKGKTSQPFGLVSGNKTMLQGGKGKIVGFHGRASHVLHALGIYISPLV
ncbi:unnamed protein product [Cochlearia groenlandica]